MIDYPLSDFSSAFPARVELVCLDAKLRDKDVPDNLRLAYEGLFMIKIAD